MDIALLQKSLEVGLLRQRDDSGYEEMSPRLAAHGRELARLGISLDRQPADPPVVEPRAADTQAADSPGPGA